MKSMFVLFHWLGAPSYQTCIHTIVSLQFFEQVASRRQLEIRHLCWHSLETSVRRYYLHGQWQSPDLSGCSHMSGRTFDVLHTHCSFPQLSPSSMGDRKLAGFGISWTISRVYKLWLYPVYHFSTTRRFRPITQEADLIHIKPNTIYDSSLLHTVRIPHQEV